MRPFPVGALHATPLPQRRACLIIPYPLVARTSRPPLGPLVARTAVRVGPLVARMGRPPLGPIPLASC